MMQLAISKSDRIITPSDSTQRDIRRLYTGGDLCTTVYHGVDTSRFNPNARVPESVDADYLLYVGSARPRKNITGLLDGFGRVVAQSRSPPRLVLAGGHDSRFVDLDSYVSRLGLEEYVIRPGYVDEDELLGLYANARAFVFPSHYEGFGFPVLEAMASGTPVVASDAAALPEVCGDAARYVDPTDAGDIASGIIDVLNDHTFSECLVKRGTKRATEFTWERTAHLTAAIYSQVCGRE
jgi:glycosyltransferase involved in cell wall biosynthesis